MTNIVVVSSMRKQNLEALNKSIRDEGLWWLSLIRDVECLGWTSGSAWLKEEGEGMFLLQHIFSAFVSISKRCGAPGCSSAVFDDSKLKILASDARDHKTSNGDSNSGAWTVTAGSSRQIGSLAFNFCYYKDAFSSISWWPR